MLYNDPEDVVHDLIGGALALVDSCRLTSGAIQKERSFIRNNHLLRDGTGISKWRGQI